MIIKAGTITQELRDWAAAVKQPIGADRTHASWVVEGDEIIFAMVLDTVTSEGYYSHSWIFTDPDRVLNHKYMAPQYGYWINGWDIEKFTFYVPVDNPLALRICKFLDGWMKNGVSYIRAANEITGMQAYTADGDASLIEFDRPMSPASAWPDPHGYNELEVNE